MGAEVRTFLLEKSRVTNASLKERSYHIFYQVLASSQRRAGVAFLGRPEDFTTPTFRGPHVEPSTTCATTRWTRLEAVA